jgi:hypothetical protein
MAALKGRGFKMKNKYEKKRRRRAQHLSLQCHYKAKVAVPHNENSIWVAQPRTGITNYGGLRLEVRFVVITGNYEETALRRFS